MIEDHPVVPWLTAERRAWIYRVAFALMPILVFHGVMSEDSASLWVAVFVTLLSTGTAAAHTPTHQHRSQSENQSDL